LESTSLVDRYHQIQARVAAAAQRMGRRPESVTLVAVSKKVAACYLEEAFKLGIRTFGEGTVQEASGKQAKLTSLPIHWHFIGHLQTNKIKRVVGHFSLIHSVDSWRLAEAISDEAIAQGLVQSILIQLNISGETSKYGLTPEDAPAFIERAARELPGVSVKGLMTLAPSTEDVETVRSCFRLLKELRDAIILSNPDAYSLEHLSMGMTQDYSVAVEEGATLIRIGNGLFGPESDYRATLKTPAAP
jgi:pyridoxal phosphate enzyme (YggS family)